jgi:ankyrin repeat protein
LELRLKKTLKQVAQAVVILPFYALLVYFTWMFRPFEMFSFEFVKNALNPPGLLEFFWLISVIWFWIVLWLIMVGAIFWPFWEFARRIRFRIRGWDLQHASKSNNGAMTGTLIQWGRDVGEREPMLGWTPLHTAARHDSHASAKVLLNHLADFEAKDSAGNTPLHIAAHGNSIIVTNLLLDKYRNYRGSDINAKNQAGWTALAVAARHNSAAVADLLIQQGANIALQTDTGGTPLQIAKRRQSVEVAKLLMEYEAEMSENAPEAPAGEAPEVSVGNVPEEDCSSPDVWDLYRAIEEDRADVALSLILADGAGTQIENPMIADTPLHSAVRNNSLEITRLLIEYGADIEAGGDNRGQRKPRSETALHAAVSGNFIDTAELLIDAGADVDSWDKFGRTPMDLAVKHPSWIVNKSLEMINLLMDSGAGIGSATDKESRTSKGATSLHIAASEDNAEGARILIEFGAQINARGHFGYTALNTAARNKAINTAKLLIDHGADLSIGSQSNNTPLHLAVSNGAIQIVNLLIDNGAEINVVNKFGISPLSMALSGNALQIARLLIDRGADTDGLDLRGMDLY